MAVGNVREECSSVLGLQIVVGLRISFVYGGLDFSFLWLSTTSGDDDIDSVDLVHLEFDFTDSVFCGFLVEDDVVSIQHMSHDLVAQNTFNWVDSVGLADLLSVGSDLMVESTSLDDSNCGLQAVPCSQDNISLDACNLLFTNNDGMCHQNWEAIEVNTKITSSRTKLHLGNITLGENCLIIGER